MPNTPTSIVCDGKVITQITNGVAGTWTTNCGTLWLDAGATTPYAGTSVTSVYFKAQNKTSTGTVTRGGDQTTVTITGLFPLIQQLRSSWRPDKRGIITNVKRDGSRNGRVLGNGATVRDWNLLFQARENDEYFEFEAFMDWHYPHKTFKFSDPHLEQPAMYQIIEVSEVEIDEKGSSGWLCRLVWVGSV